MMKRNAICFLFVAIMMAFTSFTAMAQEPVTWKASIKMTSATEGIVTLIGDIQPGWHVYGTDIPEGGPVATKLSYTATGLAWDGNAKMSPTPQKVTDSMFDMEVSYWENHVAFNRKFTTDNPAKVEVTVGISYMCCNDETCRPPKTEKFTVKPIIK